MKKYELISNNQAITNYSFGKENTEEWESSEGNISPKSFKTRLDYSEQARVCSWAVFLLCFMGRWLEASRNKYSSASTKNDLALTELNQRNSARWYIPPNSYQFSLSLAYIQVAAVPLLTSFLLSTPFLRHSVCRPIYAEALFSPTKRFLHKSNFVQSFVFCKAVHKVLDQFIPLCSTSIRSHLTI